MPAMVFMSVTDWCALQTATQTSMSTTQSARTPTEISNPDQTSRNFQLGHWKRQLQLDIN